jgi:hypothetical protein
LLTPGWLFFESFQIEYRPSPKGRVKGRKEVVNNWSGCLTSLIKKLLPREAFTGGGEVKKGL